MAFFGLRAIFWRIDSEERYRYTIRNWHSTPLLSFLCRYSINLQNNVADWFLEFFNSSIFCVIYNVLIFWFLNWIPLSRYLNDWNSSGNGSRETRMNTTGRVFSTLNLSSLSSWTGPHVSTDFTLLSTFHWNNWPSCLFFRTSTQEMHRSQPSPTPLKTRLLTSGF